MKQLLSLSILALILAIIAKSAMFTCVTVIAMLLCAWLDKDNRKGAL